jgi:CRISPR/Cas system Type II protein with McrA/HNH and RuvC-like nuclease domain
MAAKNRIRKADTQSETLPTHNELMTLIESQGYRCALSGVRLDPERAVIDHIVPVSKGGDNDIDNLQWVHTVANKMKGNMSDESFIKWCTRVARENR